ncbi:metal-binding protein [Leptolyngbya sp. FACHB-36]|uniref:metal-binding protein n=1 Tax=Leptolyngbya sp. FACHB-36 TaxID=2692808 RepID=UPI00168125E5|nr:metal-binding protein [Leptolyngbya sp. FACHB-36]MBD2019283.1 metal-binding protein [Leptolyngbya sp. FACHB-36]
MSDGKTHDFITISTSPVIGCLAAQMSATVAVTTTIGYLVGGLLLSPDLDVKSRPWRRWGWLRFIWLPYQKLVPHRSWISHTPIVGTLIQLSYLGAIVLLAATLLGIDVWTIVRVVVDRQQDVGEGNPWSVNCFALITGLCLGSWAHLVADTLSSLGKHKKKKRRP